MAGRPKGSKDTKQRKRKESVKKSFSVSLTEEEKKAIEKEFGGLSSALTFIVDQIKE